MGTFNEYQSWTQVTAIYEESAREIIVTLASRSTVSEKQALIDYLSLTYACQELASEAGEVAGDAKKILRDDGLWVTAQRKRKMALELGDCLYGIARVAKHLGLTLQDIADMNREKLQTRLKDGKIGGAGDR